MGRQSTSIKSINCATVLTDQAQKKANPCASHTRTFLEFGCCVVTAALLGCGRQMGKVVMPTPARCPWVALSVVILWCLVPTHAQEGSLELTPAQVCVCVCVCLLADGRVGLHVSSRRCLMVSPCTFCVGHSLPSVRSLCVVHGHTKVLDVLVQSCWCTLESI